MTIGVLLFATAGDRLKGDPGFPGTFSFPVEYGVVEGSYRDLIEGSENACLKLCGAAKELERKGVDAIAGDCGLMALYQKDLTEAVHIPVISSSLVLLPLMKSIIPQKRSIGVLTGHSDLLGMQHFKGAGVDNMERIQVQGMQEEPHFQKVVLQCTDKQQYNLMRKDVFSGVRKLMECCRDGLPLGAVLLECSNLAVFGGEITREFGIPVFDINVGIFLLSSIWKRELYN